MRHTACEEAQPASSRVTPVETPTASPIQKGESNASCKTWNQTPPEAQKNFRERQRLFPHKIKTLPGCAGSGAARTEVCLLRTQAEKAPVPRHLDRPHRRRRPLERLDLQPLHQRTEESRRRPRPQSAGRYRLERSFGL